MRIQKCNTCKTEFHDKPWIDECPVCRSKDINHNEDDSLFEWQNYGDINFIEHGGCLIKEDEHENCFHVLSLTTHIPDYKGKYKNPMIVAKCFIDLSDYLKPEDEDRKLFNICVGFDEDYIPQTLDEEMNYCVDLINYYGVQEFDPDFPEETGCGCYALGTVDKWIVGKTIVQRFMKECDVPVKFRK